MKIKRDKSLIELSDKLNKSENDVSSAVVRALKHSDVITADDFGMCVNSICANGLIPVPVDLILSILCLKATDYILTELFSKLIVTGNGDCPECGGSLDIEECQDGAIKWDTERCDNCEYTYSDEPDWDSMSGGHDDY